MIGGVGEYFASLQFWHSHYKLAKTLQIVTKTSRISAEILVLSLPFFLNIYFFFINFIINLVNLKCGEVLLYALHSYVE